MHPNKHKQRQRIKNAKPNYIHRMGRSYMICCSTYIREGENVPIYIDWKAPRNTPMFYSIDWTPFDCHVNDCLVNHA